MKKFFNKLFRLTSHKKSPAAEEVEESSDSDHDPGVQHLEPPNMDKLGRHRMSVSAEVYGEFNKREHFIPTVHQKTDEKRKRIKTMLADCFLFNTLDEEDVEKVIDAFKEFPVEPNTTIIQQADDADNLFLIEEGVFDVFKKKYGATTAEKVSVMHTGDIVGELALLYNSPRAATVICVEKAITWTLDRQTFNHIVRDSAVKKRSMYDIFLAEVELLKEMDPYERSKLSDALKAASFEEGVTIIQEGAIGDRFYLIERGTAIAMKGGVEMMTYGRGDYFGELALLRNQPRAATVTAQTAVKAVYFDRKSFQRLLGPLEDMLRRNMSKYTAVMQRLEETP